jgi:hypothetical protein
MIPSSVRRVVAAAPQTPIFSPHAAFWASSAPKAAASINLTGRPGGHQRRCSSSKPSSPDNGSKDMPSGQSVPASASSRSDSTKSGEKRKRKAKASGERSDFQRLPSVPSTQHLSQEGTFYLCLLVYSSFLDIFLPLGCRSHCVLSPFRELYFC